MFSFFRWFIHFYALGLIWNIFLLAMFLQTVIKEDPSYPGILGNIVITSSTRVDCFSVLLTLVLLTIQLFRRLYECLFVLSFSGKMHLGHYVIGVLFYFLVNLTVVAEIPLPLSKGTINSFIHCYTQFFCSQNHHKLCDYATYCPLFSNVN
jgi:hypothetical protein